MRRSAATAARADLIRRRLIRFAPTVKTPASARRPGSRTGCRWLIGGLPYCRTRRNYPTVRGRGCHLRAGELAPLHVFNRLTVLLRDRDGNACGVGAAAAPDCLPWCPDADLIGANLIGTKLLHATLAGAILSRTPRLARTCTMIAPEAATGPINALARRRAGERGLVGACIPAACAILRSMRLSRRLTWALRVLAIALVMLTASGCEEAPGGRASHDVHCAGSYGVSGKTLSPPDWIRGTWQQPYRAVAMGFITLSWTFTERNAVNSSHSGADKEELEELDEQFEKGLIYRSER